MAHIVDTNVAAVKMSGSFSVPDFSSSDEEQEGEEEILCQRRPRSNAVLESKEISSGPLMKTHVPPSILSDRQKPGPLSLSKPISNAYYATGVPSQPSTTAFSSSQLVSTTTQSESQLPAVQQRNDTGNTDLSHASSDHRTVVKTNNRPFSHSQNNEETSVTIDDKSDKGRESSGNQNSSTVSASPSNNRNKVSSPDGLSSISSPVMVNKTNPQRITTTNGNLSSASAASSVSSSREMYFQSRFNPFDRDIHLEEDHFSDNPDSNFFSRRSSSPVSAQSSQSGDHWNEGGSVPEDSDTVTFAELGLAEDHFSHPEGHFGLSQTEELEMAIDNCKALIRKANPDSDRQKNLVQKLVQLRLKLQEMKDEPEVKEKNVIVASGHRLIRKNSRSSKYYCEKCNSIIWGLVQEWRKCLDCGYRCHDKCVPQITRNCAMAKVKENPVFIMEICPRHPKGLLAQDYRCAECKAQIPVADGVEPRLCEYSGRYYCELCHWNDVMYIPAQILLNWEFEKQKVCRASKQFLKLMMKKAVINVQEINPMLFNYVEQLSDIKNLREELLMMKKYILACPAAMQAKMLLQLSSRPHFVECSDRYSLQDLLDSDDSLIPDLVQVHSSWAQHIKTDCELCQGRGYFCELCTSKEVLFPFDNVAVVCTSCSAVMHRICFAQQVICPKCERRRKRQEEENTDPVKS